jgi:hypothetical protein
VIAAPVAQPDAAHVPAWFIDAGLPAMAIDRPLARAGADPSAPLDIAAGERTGRAARLRLCSLLI